MVDAAFKFCIKQERFHAALVVELGQEDILIVLFVLRRNPIAPLWRERRRCIIAEIEVLLYHFRMHNPRRPVFAQKGYTNRVDEWLECDHFESLVEDEQGGVY